MDCKIVNILLHPYFDGELDEGTAASVKAHLSECVECERELAARAFPLAAGNQPPWHLRGGRRALGQHQARRVRGGRGIELGLARPSGPAGVTRAF